MFQGIIRNTFFAHWNIPYMSTSSNPDKLSTTPKNQFRHDINGLRAWAVVAVVLYHFGVPGFSGGFVGVDIFFVISGFLMTSIIIKGLEQGNFSLWEFYLARARRIIPALLVLCVSLLILGWFWLPSLDYKTLGTHAVTALVFVSNIKYWREAGYFDAASHEKWLLHTWSLSVEWQFYILLPLALLSLWNWFGRRCIKIALVISAIVSLLLSIYISILWPDAAFYLLPTRAWEMLAGGLIWWITRTKSIPLRWAKLTEKLGFVLIVTAIGLFDPTMQWPGYLALIPVTGAMLVLAANNSNSWLTINPIAQYLGNSSYSTYLWHWPIVVILNYAGNSTNPKWIIIGVCFSVLLGELSLRLVENPTRKSLTKLLLPKQSQVIGCTVVIAILMALGVRYQQIEWRLNSAIELAINESYNFNPSRDKCLLSLGKGIDSPLCQFGNGTIKVIVMGDSHANAVVSAVQYATGSAIELTYSGCQTVLGMFKKNAPTINMTDCNNFNLKAISQVNTEFSSSPIVIVNRFTMPILGQNEKNESFSGKPSVFFDINYDKPNDRLNKQYADSLINTVCSIENPKRIYLVRPIPEMGVNVPKVMARTMMFGKAEPNVSISLEEYHLRHAVVWAAQDEAARQCGIQILNPLPYLCHDGYCRGSKDGRPIYYDDDHLSEFGNKLLTPMFSQILK